MHRRCFGEQQLDMGPRDSSTLRTRKSVAGKELEFHEGGSGFKSIRSTNSELYKRRNVTDGTRGEWLGELAA